MPLMIILGAIPSSHDEACPVVDLDGSFRPTLGVINRITGTIEAGGDVPWRIDPTRASSLDVAPIAVMRDALSKQDA